MFSEIRRRKVMQGAVAYAMAGWLAIQLGIALEDALELPAYVDRWVTIAVFAGFPFALLVSWVFDITLDGIRVTPDPEVSRPQPIFSEDVLADRTAVQTKSIAVLPFADMSPERNQEHFADGVSEEILNALVKVTELKVAGRTSSFTFKGKNEDVRSIGEILGVAHVLEGSIRKQGDRVRITAQLIKASDGFHLWSETYDGDLTDIFDLQDSIAKAIVGELSILLEGESDVRLSSSLTTSPEAYEYFLRARQLVHQQTGQDTLPTAVDLLERAVALDPLFAEAWAWLADAHFSLPDQSRTRRSQHHFDAGRQALDRSMALDPHRPHVFHAAGYRASIDRQVAEMAEQFRKGHEIDPNDAELMVSFGIGLNAIGLSGQGLPLIRDGLAKEPLMPAHIISQGLAEWSLGDADAAGKLLRRSSDLGAWQAAYIEAYRLSCVDSARKAIDYLQVRQCTLPVMSQYFFIPFSWFVYTLAVFRKIRLFRGLLALLLPLLVRTGIATPTVVPSAVFFFIGHPTAFMRSVDRYTTCNLMVVSQFLFLPSEEARRIRTHREFPKFAERIGLVEAWQKYGWPPQIQPVPGTDGSNLQFTCR